jgi:hypothetical protein
LRRALILIGNPTSIEARHDRIHPLTQSPAWQALLDHRRSTADCALNELFEQDPARFERFALRCGDLLVDFSKKPGHRGNHAATD